MSMSVLFPVNPEATKNSCAHRLVTLRRGVERDPRTYIQVHHIVDDDLEVGARRIPTASTSNSPIKPLREYLCKSFDDLGCGPVVWMSTPLFVTGARVLLVRRTHSHCQFIDKWETYEPDVVSNRIFDQQPCQIRGPHLSEVDPVHLTIHRVWTKLRPPIHRVQRSREEPGRPPVGFNVVPDPIHLVCVVRIRLAVPPIPCSCKDLGGDETRVQLGRQLGGP